MAAAIHLKDEEIVAAFRSSFGLIAAVTQRLGISRQTLMRRLTFDRELRKACYAATEEAELGLDDVALAGIIHAVRRGDRSAAKWWLVRFAPEEFGHRRPRLSATKAS